MARTTKKKIIAKAPQEEVLPASWNGVMDKLRWEESYMSLILGILVVFIAGFLISSYIKSRNIFGGTIMKQEINSDKSQKEKDAAGNQATKSAQPTTNVAPGQKITGNSYTVKAGDQLWEISLRAYGDENKWPEIAQANNLSSPDAIEEGMVLKILR